MNGKELDYFSALYEMAKVVNASLDPERILHEIVHFVTRTLAVKACSIRLLDTREKRLVMGAYHGLSADYVQKGPVLVEESGIDQKALKGETIYLKDAQTDRDFQYSDEAREEGIKSVLVVPLTAEEKVIGVLRVYTDRVREFSNEEIRFLEAVANLSALAIQNARLHQMLKLKYDISTAHKYRIDDN